MLRRSFLISILILWGATTARAGDVPAVVASTPKVSVGALIQEALTNNPRLKAARYRAEAAQARTSLFRNIPDPELEYEYDRIIPSMVMGSDKVRPMKTLAVSQEIPFPTKIYLRKKSAQKEAKAMEEDARETERAVIKDVKSAYAQMFLIRHKITLTQDSLRLLNQAVEVLNRKYAANDGRQSDVLRAQVEYAKMSNALTLYQSEEKIAESLLISLLGRKDDAAFDLADDDSEAGREFTEADMVALAKENRPELRSSRDLVEKSRLESSLSKQEFLPDVTLKYKRNEKDGSFREGDWSGMIGVNVPLWFWNKQSSGVKEARANLDAARADEQATEDTVVFEVKSALAKYDAARRLVNVFETGVLPQAEAEVATARRSYEAGTLGFIEILEPLKMLRELQMEYFSAVADQQVALADLEMSVGKDLQE